jgi:hypothetical protein
MDTYGLAATLLLALCGPKQFPGEAATDRSELAEAQEVRTTQPLGPAALPEVTGAARDALTEAFRRWLAHEPQNRPSMKELAEQLEVLLEPEREEERLEERRRERQKTTIGRLRAGVALMLIVGAAGAAVAYSRRAELALAGQLAAARRAGAQSFDKLDTCVASHRMATLETAQCRAAGDKARAEFQRSLDEVMHSGSTSEADHAREVQRTSSRIKTLEDTVTAVRRSSDEETKRLVAENQRARAELVAERDAARSALEHEKIERVTVEAQRDVCKGERATCVEERDACRAAAKAAPPPAAPHAPPPASATPIASVDPATPPGPAPGPAPAPPPPQPPLPQSPQQQPAQAAPPEPRGAPAQPRPEPEPTGT